MDNAIPLPKEQFETLEEWHSDAERKYLIGILPFTALKNGNWWKENNTSLILMPDPIVESMEVVKLKKISLELAGIS
jgi:homoserine dehydrogenase